MPAQCYSSIKGLAMRGTRIDSLGRWTTGTTASVVSDGFVSIGFTANIEAGAEYRQKKASGTYCVNEKGRDAINWYDVEMNFCEVNPSLFELFTGARLLTDASANQVGYTIPNQFPDTRAAMEVWTQIPAATSTAQYLYFLLPGMRNFAVGDFTIEDAVATFTLRGQAFANANWGFGPYNVVGNAGGSAVKLTEGVLPYELVYQRTTPIAPPTAACGYVSQLTGWIPPV